MCQNCQATIAELIGVRLIVIIRGYTVNFPVVLGTIFTCRKCGYPNVLESLPKSPLLAGQQSAERAASHHPDRG